MAVLSVEQAIKLIKTPKHAQEIQRAKLKRQRHKLHTEPETDCDYLLMMNPSHQRFLLWVQRILKSEDNYSRFLELYRPPVPTNELCESIFSQFEKVFESENKYEKFTFIDSDLESDAAAYRKRIGDFTFWETQGFETFKDSIDNILIVDLPKLDDQVESDDPYPQPYYYFLDIDNLIDIHNVRIKCLGDDDQQAYFFRTEYVIFYEDPKTVCVFDDQFYRVFLWEPGTEPVLLSEVMHDLKYCPARSFWTTPLNSKTMLMKRSPITGSLSKLDWLLFQEIAAEYLKMYASYPIYAVYKGICNYKDPKNGAIKCVDGFLTSGLNAEKTNTRCPKCGNKMKTGPGNILELQAPQDKDDPDLLANPIKVIPADEVSVNVVNEELRTLKQEIFKNCVGGGLEIDQSQAKNEDQVQAGFEGKTNTLLKIKKNFETAHQFVIDTVFRLRYGDKYVSGTIDYGDVFFQKDESDAMDEYKVAQEQKLPAFDLSIRRKKINETRYRNNPDMIERLEILFNLDPFPDDNVDTIAATYSSSPSMVNQVDLCIKNNFNRFIARFEREQTNILQFASAVTFDKKISTIYSVLQSYAIAYLDSAKPADGGNPSMEDTLKAQATLRGSVGGVTGILSLQASVGAKTTSYDAAIALLVKIYGFTEQEAKDVLGDPATPAPQPAPAFG